MKADKINDIVSQIEKLPYRCFLFDGKWGIGKTYAVKKALERKDNVCQISLFGLQDASQIYHEALFQFMLKNNSGGKIGEKAGEILQCITDIFGKAGQIKEIVNKLVSEKEVFLTFSETFKTQHIIVLDDLERISQTIQLQEILGIVEELKQCNYMKVILIANTEEFSGENKDIFDKYNEKVIDKVYSITERPNKVNWSELGIDDAFIMDFLRQHDVMNLRTLQKAQKFYDDVRVQYGNIGNEEFDWEVRLICFSIVVEDIENLYYKNKDTKSNGSTEQCILNISNDFQMRMFNYLGNIKSKNGLFQLLLKYYKNETEIDDVLVRQEFEIFLKSGEKENFYKNDREIKDFLRNWQEAINGCAMPVEVSRVADEYVFWGECIGENTDDIVREYEKRLKEIIYQLLDNGQTDFLNYDSSIMNIDTEAINQIYVRERNRAREKVIDNCITFLIENISDDRVYEMSQKLRSFYGNAYYKDIVDEKADRLFCKSSFPIENVDKNRYYTCVNILYVLWKCDDEKLKKYVKQLECDNMARHRIKCIIKELKEQDI